MSFASKPRQLQFGPAARELWAEIYPALSAARPGLLGAILARAEAQALRLACIYTLLDQMTEIGAEHLQAALAMWRYCEASAHYIFGDSLGDPDADAILSALRTNHDGLTRTDISQLFGRNRPVGQIERALSELLKRGLAKPVMVKPEIGRPAEKWRAVLK